MDLGKWKDKIKNLLDTAKTLISKFSITSAALALKNKLPQRNSSSRNKKANTVPFGSKSIASQKNNSVSGRLLAHFPENRRKPILFGFSGLVVLFLLLLIGAMAINSGQEKSERPVPRVAAGPSIPLDDLFLPSEPNFLPDYLLEREKHQYWSIEDIRPYWKDPLQPSGSHPVNQAFWRDEIKPAIDELMEAFQ